MGLRVGCFSVLENSKPRAGFMELAGGVLGGGSGWEVGWCLVNLAVNRDV